MNCFERIQFYNPKSIRHHGRPRWRIGTREIVHQGAAQTKNGQCFAYAKGMRRRPTAGEEAFREILRRMRIASKIKRQCVMFGYILDFFWPHKFLAFEIDGSSHDNKQEYDAVRTERLASHNISVMRFTNEQVLNYPQQVMASIKRVARFKRRPSRGQPIKEYRAEHYSQEELRKLVQTS